MANLKTGLGGTDMGTSLKVAHLYFAGMKQKEIAKRLRLTPSSISRSLSKARQFIEFNYTIPGDERLEAELLVKYKLVDCVVVETADTEIARTVVGQAAARYFMGNVADGDSIAMSCGETLLEMIKAIPPQRNLTLRISQMSIEGDPESIHQAPAALVGLLRAKLSHKSDASGIQLPPVGTIPEEKVFREQLGKSLLIEKFRSRIKASRFAFIGVGPIKDGEVQARSFICIKDASVRNAVKRAVEKYGLIGEINNRLFDEQGRDRTSEIPEFSSYFVNIIDLDELRRLAKAHANVVLVATGVEKRDAIAVALRTGLANVVVTDRRVAEQLLGS